MTDLTNILGGPWIARERDPEPPEQQLLAAMREHGLDPRAVVMDGCLHRFDTEKKGGKAGWYVAFGDGVPAASFGNWKTGEAVNWRADIGRELDVAEQMAHAQRVARMKAIREAEIAERQAITADTVETIWSGGAPASAEHPYLQRKGIEPHGARVTGDGRLMVPLFDGDALASLQYIDADGGKLYHSGGRTGGCYHQIGEIGEVIYVAEGFATAATIHEETGEVCFAAYSASNIVPVVERLAQIGKRIVVVADNDIGGVGKKYADQAAALYGVAVVMPPEPGDDANDYRKKGGDLLALLQPKPDEWLVSADEFSREPAPLTWLVKHWVPEKALMMVHGPSGVGKSFVVLDWAMLIAAGGGEWFGNKVKGGTVVYLAGEGHHGLKARIAAWKVAREAGDLAMYVSQSGCALNTAEGYSKVVQSIRSLPAVPDLIQVDTLHRFNDGDENSSQDARTMLEACGGLIREFGCTVMLVHHTGVAENAQDRARGSTAWKGALDMEVSVQPPKSDSGPIALVQKKAKDSEMAKPLHFKLEPVEIPGWFDEDGEPVVSVVVEEAEAPVESKKEKVLELRRKFERYWWTAGAELMDGDPYLSRAALVDLIEKDGHTPAYAEKMVKPSKGFIGELLADEYIQSKAHGWIVVDVGEASAMRMRRGT